MAKPRATVYLGADDSRHTNKLTYDNDTIKIAGTYLYGDHVITGGYDTKIWTCLTCLFRKQKVSIASTQLMTLKRVVLPYYLRKRGIH